MKDPTYTLQIKNPCKEDWSKMDQQGRGRFCSNCTLTVIDFTSLSDKEILDLFADSMGRMCARANPGQMNRHLVKSYSPTRSRGFYRIISALFSLVIANDLNGQHENRHTQENTKTGEVSSESAQKSNTVTSTSEKTTIIVKGTLKDEESKYGIPFARLIIQPFGVGTTTDIDGRFTFSFVADLPSDMLTIVADVPYYEVKTIPVEQTSVVTIFIRPDGVMIPEVQINAVMPELIDPVMGRVHLVEPPDRPEAPCKCAHKKWWQFWKQ